MDPDARSRLTLGVIVAVLVVAAVVRGVISEEAIIFLAVLVPSVILHEVSHGALAFLFGDDTAKRAGRLTLNPVSHIDPLGTVVLPAMLAVSGFPPFGYAKPVPVNVRALRSPRNQSLLVSLVGPATNIVLALVAIVVAKAVVHPRVIGGQVVIESYSVMDEVILSFGLINVVLAAFNLIPLPPLDGSALVERVLPARLWEPYLRFRRYSMVLLIAIVFLVPNGTGFFIEPALDLWVSLLR